MRAPSLTIRVKLIAGLAACAAILLVVGGLGIRGQSRSNADARAIFEESLEPVLHLTKVRGAEFANQALISQLLVGRDAVGAKLAARRIAEHTAQVEQAWSAYYPRHVGSVDERAVADAVLADRKVIDRETDTLLELIGQGDFASAAQRHAERYLPAYDRLIPGTRTLFAMNEQQARDAFAESQESFASTRVEALAAIGAGFVLMALLLATLLRAIATPIHRAASLADAIAGGQLNHAVDARRSDEVGVLLRALQRMDVQLTTIVRDVRRRAESVATGSREIAHGNDDLSQRTQEQASSLEEVASSMEQMSATVRHNADHATQASALARDTLASAEQSGRVASDAVDAMASVSAASHRISEIVGLIDEIAFQTNLLALNAAVEAARAGEQGRGFAVVASAVRELSQRSATAAREIKSLIGESTERVDKGVALVGASGRALSDMLERVRKVNDLVAEIAAANAEQTGGIHQVSLAVSQLDEVTQQNAALVEQAAAASMALQDQAGGLLGRVAFFRIHGEPPGDAPTLPASALVHVNPAATHIKATVALSRAVPLAKVGQWREF